MCLEPFTTLTIQVMSTVSDLFTLDSAIVATADQKLSLWRVNTRGTALFWQINTWLCTLTPQKQHHNFSELKHAESIVHCQLAVISTCDPQAFDLHSLWDTENKKERLIASSEPPCDPLAPPPAIFPLISPAEQTQELHVCAEWWGKHICIWWIDCIHLIISTTKTNLWGMSLKWVQSLGRNLNKMLVTCVAYSHLKTIKTTRTSND